MHLRCRSLAHAQVVNESQDQSSKQNVRVTRRHLPRLKIDLIGVTEKIPR